VNEATKILRGLAYGVTIGSRALPGQGRTIGGWIGEALGLVGDMIEAGTDPGIELRRIRTSDTYTAGPRARWAAHLEELRRRAADDADPHGDDLYLDLDR
jgi:hypothetical protein